MDDSKACVYMFICCYICCCLSFIVGPAILFVILLPSGSLITSTTDNIGDILGSSGLISVDSTVSSVTISLTSLNSLTWTANVSLSSTKPSVSTEYLPHTTLISPPSLLSPISFDYLGADNPIYLLPGSKLLYNVSVSSVKNTSECPARLHLFNDIINYLASSDAILSSPCLSVEFQTLWTVNINDSSSYYVRIEKNDEVHVTSVTSVVRVYYNTTNLKKINECNLLTYDKSSCTVTTCGSTCNRQDEYIIVKPTDNVDIQYDFTPSILNRRNLAAFISIIVLLFVCCCMCLVCCTCMIFMSEESNRPTPPGLQEEIQTSNNISVNNIGVTNFQPNNFNLQGHYHFDDRSSISSSEEDCSESACLLQHEQQSSRIKESPLKPPHAHEMDELSSSLLHTSMLNTPFLQNDSSVVHDTPSLSVDLLDQDSPLSSVSLSCSNMQFDRHSIKQDQTSASCSDYKMKCVTATASEESKVSSYPKTDLIPDIQIIKTVFENLTVLELTATGLVHHCSEYGVTLIIPEGAVEGIATVWFGVALLSDKFKFKHDVVPVSPIVWVYINCQLKKPAELYIPHHIDVSNLVDPENQLYLLTADDESFIRNSTFAFKQNHENQVIIESTLVKILASHFCSNCVATTGNSHNKIPKRYLIARADKKVDDVVFVDFSFLYQQPGCVKTVQEQCRKEDYTLSRCLPVTFNKIGQVSLSFQPETIPDWKWSYIGFCYDYISEDSIDYYKMMGCEGGEVTSDNIKMLELLEDFLSYPPRFQLKFSVEENVSDARSQNVTVRFNGVHPPTTVTIVLEKADSKNISLPLTPNSSSSSLSPDLSLTNARFFSKETDPLFGEILNIITSDSHLSTKWFNFGFQLGLTVGQLDDIEMRYHDPLQCTRKVLLQWRVENKSASWEPLTEALRKIGLTELANDVEYHFTAQEKSQTSVEVDGIYCSLCNKYHGINSYHSQDVIPHDTLQTVPSIAVLNDLIGAKIEDKYHLFGVAVGLEEGYLNSLRIDYSTCQDRFNQVFNKWHQTDPDNFTWGTVINVLQSDTIKAQKVVESITDYLTS